MNNDKANYGNLIWSNSLTCASNGDVFLVDRFEHRILVFNKEFIYKYSIGSKGSEPGEFDEPSDVCMNESGKLYVADKNNKRLQIFSESKQRNRRGDTKSVKLSASFGCISGSHTPNTTTIAKTKIFRASGEFAYQNYIELEDKPVKLCSAPFSGIMGVSTKNGNLKYWIFI